MGLKLVSFRHLEIVIIRDRFMNAISHGGEEGSLERRTRRQRKRIPGDSSLREGESCSDTRVPENCEGDISRLH